MRERKMTRSSTKLSTGSDTKRTKRNAATPTCSRTYFTRAKFMPQMSIVASAAASDQDSLFTLAESRIRAMLARFLCAVLACGFAALAAAQAYPAKPIRIVVPWAPGGSTDVLARLIGIKMSENWGQPAVVENKPGASGNIGSELVAKAPPDGYTLLLGSVSTHAMNPFLVAAMPFKGVDDFTTIALAAYVTNVLVTHPSVPAKSVSEP